jgi:hypothetical protein
MPTHIATCPRYDKLYMVARDLPCTCPKKCEGCHHKQHVGPCKGKTRSGEALINCNCVAVLLDRWQLENIEKQLLDALAIVKRHRERAELA